MFSRGFFAVVSSLQWILHLQPERSSAQSTKNWRCFVPQSALLTHPWKPDIDFPARISGLQFERHASLSSSVLQPWFNLVLLWSKSWWATDWRKPPPWPQCWLRPACTMTPPGARRYAGVAILQLSVAAVFDLPCLMEQKHHFWKHLVHLYTQQAPWHQCCRRAGVAILKLEGKIISQIFTSLPLKSYWPYFLSFALLRYSLSC